MSDLWKIEEPMPAPQHVRLGDKPAREMTMREEFVKAAMQGLFSNSAVDTVSAERTIGLVDVIIAALEGSAGK